MLESTKRRLTALLLSFLMEGMFFSLGIPKSIFQEREGESADAWSKKIRIEASADLCRQEFHGSQHYILIGRVYGESTTPLKNLAQRLYLQNESVQGRFLFIEFDREKNHITFWLDKYRLLNPVIDRTGKEIQLTNRLEDFAGAAHLQLDPIAAESLRDFGAVIYPYTLIKNKMFLTGNARWKAQEDSFYEEDQALAWPREGTPTSTEEWLTIFQSALDNLFENWRPQFFRMSGGVDTRLMALLLSPEARRNLQGQVLCHPQLSADQDRDVLGAQQIAQLLHIKLETLSPEKAAYNYVGGIKKDARALSGLYGGEFLGGLMNNFAPWLKPLQQLQVGNKVHELWKARLEQLGPRRLTTEHFLSAFRSTIYRSVHRSWASPWQLNQLSLSPFVEQKVLDALLRTSMAELENYQVYAAIFKKAAGEYASLPLTSPIVALQPGFMGFTVGQEPKSLASPTEITQAKKSLGEQNLEYFLQDHLSIKP